MRFWEWRQRLLAKMKACFELAKAPDPPSKVDISVVSPTSIKVSFSPPKNTNGSLVTRYKCESHSQSSFVLDFSMIPHSLHFSAHFVRKCVRLSQGLVFLQITYITLNIVSFLTNFMPMVERILGRQNHLQIFYVICKTT